MITKKKGKQIIQEIEPIAQKLLSISDKLGEHEIVSMAIANDQVNFTIKAKAGAKEKFVGGIVWNKTSFADRGRFDYSEV